MLYLNPPYYLIEGISLFSDHADPLIYYFMPIAPHLTVIKDASSGKHIPSIEVIKYRGRAGNGGFLSFDVNLGVEPDVLETIRAKLRQVARLRTLPNLVPVPLVDGSVKMLLFGAQSGDAASGTDSELKFVLKINHHAKPSLYGDNQAAFSVQLDQYGVTVLEKALQGEISPIGIVYSLDYLALRPAYSVRLNVDWERVQKHMEEQFSAKIFISSVEIDKAVDELIEKRTINIEADTFVPEGEDSAGIISRRDQALNEVRDMVTNAFFEPTLSPTKQEKDGWDKATEIASRAVVAGLTGGWSEAFGFSYKKVDYTRIDKKTLNVNISERTTVKRSIFPQGHLTGLFRIFKQEGLDPKGFLIDVDLDDKWFERRKIKVNTNANFEEDSLSSVNVMMRYGTEPKNVLLTAAAPESSLEWASIITNDAMLWDVFYSYRVTFKGIDSTERPVTLTSPELKCVDNQLEITPRTLFSIVPVKILALTPFPWKRYSAVEAHVRYTDEENGIRITDTFLLKEQEAEQTWKMFIINPQRQNFEYKLVYRAANNKDITLPWVETGEEEIMIRDPFPQKRTLQIVPNFNWEEVERAFVDVSYEDKVNHISESESFEFNADDKATKIFSVDLRNMDLRTVAYQVTVLFVDGITYEVPRSFTRANRIIIHKNLQGHRIVSVRPVATDFIKKKAKTMKIEIRYEDSANGLSFSDAFDFDEKTSNGVAYFEYEYLEKPAYEYRISVRFLNGLSKTTNWQKSNVDDLVIPIN